MRYSNNGTGETEYYFVVKKTTRKEGGITRKKFIIVDNTGLESAKSFDTFKEAIDVLELWRYIFYLQKLKPQ